METTWTTKYRNHEEFMAYFLCEQEYIDAVFIQMILFNFGIWLDADKLIKV